MLNQVVRLSTASAVMGAAAIIITHLGALAGPAQAAESGAGTPAPSVTARPTATATVAGGGAAATVDKAAARPVARTDATAGVAHASQMRREPRRASPADSDAYRCHPSEDISCTVVRETAGGMTIVTMRPGAAASPASWSVVSGAPPGGSAYPGGIIYVVPTATVTPPRFESMDRATDVTLVTANDAPILD